MFDQMTAQAIQGPAHQLAGEWHRGLMFPAPLTVDQWADKYRYIAAGMSPAPGKWSTDRMPHLREIMVSMSPSHSCTDVTFMGSSQTSGKTDTGINWLGYIIAHDPDSILMVMPNHKQIKRFSKRLDRNAACTPVMATALKPRSRKDSDSTELKDFDGGILYFGSAESPSDLASITARYVNQSEIDRFPQDVDGEGDPCDLADARTTMFGDRAKRYKESSPTIESLSRINRAFLRGDQSYRYVPCPHCGEYQRLTWKGVKWPLDKPQHAHYICEHTGCVIEEHHKAHMLKNGVAQWRATFPERSARHRSFQISALYSPVGLGKTWGDLAQEFLACKGEKNKLKVFVNTRLAECWIDNDEKVDWEVVKGRAEPYKLRTVPRRCGLITAGVDVQKNRWEIVILGWDRHSNATVLDYAIIAGDTADRTQWVLLEEYLSRPLTSELGPAMRIDIALIDSGYLQHDVLAFTRMHKGDRWYGTKGSSYRNKPLITKPRKVELKHGDKVDKRGAEQYEIGLDTAKDIVYANLHADKDRLLQDRKFRFSADLQDEFFKTLCSEVFDPHKQRYEKMPGHRNEGLDCVVLCIAATQHSNIRMDRMQDAEWDLRDQLHGLGGNLSLFAGDSAAPESPAKPPSIGSAQDAALLAMLTGNYQTTKPAI